MRNSYVFNRDLKDLSGPVQAPKHRALIWVRLAGVAVASAALWLTSVTIASISTQPHGSATDLDSVRITPPAQLLRLAQEDGGEQLTRVPPAGSPDIGNAALAASGSYEEAQWRNRIIEPGDTLEKILLDEGLVPADVHNLMALEQARLLNRLIAGHRIHLQARDGQLLQLYYDLSAQTRLRVSRDDNDSLVVSNEDRNLERRLRNVSGTISSSLFDAGLDAGLTDALILGLVEIFGWDVDFVLDLRRGDSFAVVFEELYENGVLVGTGDIIAAEFVNQGQLYRAVRHLDDSNGRREYYTPEGQSLRRAFLKSPVKFTRISSKFSMGRFHPVLKRWRAHRGVDYAAPRGTPVVSTATGRVVHVGRKGGYGNTVIVRHGGRYSTLYAHLTSYRKGLRKGDTVHQGDTVGYVGSTGLATGPHLHYEFQVNGRHADPLTFEHPRAEPLAKAVRKEFRERATRWERRLDLISRSTAPLQAVQTGSTTRSDGGA